MKRRDVEIGATYAAKVSGVVVPVRITDPVRRLERGVRHRPRTRPAHHGPGRRRDREVLPVRPV